MKYYCIAIFTAAFILFSFASFAQKKTTIEIKHADKLKLEKGKNVNILIGHVFLKHKNMRMYCDRAYKYNKTNTITAFGNIHIIQNDTLHMKGDKLYYNGNSRYARVRNNVILNDTKVTLTTDSLDYDAEKNIGYYFNHGKVKDSINTLTSIIGQYHANEKLLCFQDSVIVDNPDYKMYSDTLKYTTQTKIVMISGPTDIVGEKDTLYTEKGWYNTITKQVELKKNNRAHRESYFCYGDYFHIDNVKKTALIKNNGILHDTINQIMLKANYIQAFKKQDYAYATGKAHFIQIDKNKDSLFLHADTLSLSKDTINTTLHAHHNVKFFKSSMQGICDSLTYTSVDSTIRLFKNPIVWASNNQITGDHIRLEVGGKALKKFYVDKNSLIVSEADTDMYNQIKGRNMIGYFKNNFIDYIDVKGNGQLLYFPLDKGAISGVNKTICSDIKIYMKNKKLNSVVFLNKPDGTIFPLTKIEAKELRFKDFRWEKIKQPKSKEDIFTKNRKRANDKKINHLKE